MNNPQHNKASLKMPGGIRRKAVSASAENLVKIDQLHSEDSLPLLIQPAMDEVDLLSWATNNRDLLNKHLLKYGGILFRNFALQTADDFERLITSISGDLLEYRERSSPRSQITGNVYTSTDHPADQSIFLHNENSYQQAWPRQIFFFCKLPAQEGGETPIADVRKVYERIDPAIRERFRQKKVMYVRNFGDGFGLSWQTVFQTDDKQAVEEYCRKSGMQCEWKDGNRLRTRRIGQAVARHPSTGEMLWFNHATFFHVTTLEAPIREALLAQLKEEDLPSNTYYGDGSPIEDTVLAELRAAYMQETVAFPWQKGDVLMLDNMAVAHGRAPFAGKRQVLTGMTHAFQSADLDVQ
jgi:alpha-ketoglutarate-dependent taurine dioxygenase